MNYPTMYYQPPMQQYGMPQMQQPQQQAQAPMMRMVTCYEEVVASQVPFDGSQNWFADLGHGRVYMKRFNMNTGLADIIPYKVEQNEPKEQQAWATEQAVEELAGRVKALEEARHE